MLSRLHVANLGVFEDLEVEFPRGLICLTGETGAGKSLLVDAIELLLGGRAEEGTVRPGAREALVEAFLEVPEAARSDFEEAGYGPEEGEVHLRRTVGADGRSRAWIQGRMATLKELRELGGRLVSVAGQHAFLTLSSSRERLAMVDVFGECLPLVQEYRQAWERWRELDRQVAQGRASEADRERRLEDLRYLVDQVARWEPRVGEDREVEDRIRLLRGVEKYREAAGRIEERLYEGAGSVFEQVGRLTADAREMVRLDEGSREVLDRLEAMQIEARELAREAARRAAALASDPGELARLEDRLDGLRTLARRHGGSLEAVLAAREEARREMAELEAVGSRLPEWERELEGLRRERDRLGEALSGRRRAAAAEMERRVTEAVRQLAMPAASVQIRVDSQEPGERGLDRVEFQVQTNPGMGFGDLADVASGGELSRLMLAFDSVLRSSVGTPVVVYDEIDAGLSGAVAERMAEVLSRTARRRQVLVVTHHGQVAARADAHFGVEKEVVNGTTTARVRRLEGPDRLREIARLIGGREMTPAVLAHAAELLGSAGDNR
ncbi:MAG TPA: DNA repair protein RecN [Myxococcota bacterium]|nr:DNA repair protein RecN [Myxococcota bacterium]HQK52318.1 DNA repair protein RecN [Myxococcota bacterium]